MTHELKIQKEYADAILSGDKNFEVRYNDRGYQKGDHIKFKEVLSDNEYYSTFYPEHALLDKKFEITYVLNGFGLQKNYVVLAIKEITDERDSY